MAVTLAQFLKQLAESGLMSAEEIRVFHEGLPAALRNRDPDAAQEVARELVRQKKLTAYQANAVYKGTTRGLLLEDYVLLDKLGEGGMGMVFKAEHRRMGRVVAVKVLPPAVSKKQPALLRFQREVRAAARLSHRNIVSALDARESQGVHWNLVEIEFRGPNLGLKINGRTIQDVQVDKLAGSGKHSAGLLQKTGRVALECRSGRAEFRNIEIQELAPAK